MPAHVTIFVLKQCYKQIPGLRSSIVIRYLCEVAAQESSKRRPKLPTKPPCRRPAASGAGVVAVRVRARVANEVMP